MQLQLQLRIRKKQTKGLGRGARDVGLTVAREAQGRLAVANLQRLAVMLGELAAKKAMPSGWKRG